MENERAMTYDKLLEFVQDCMPQLTQHISLPLLVVELVESDGSATIRQLATAVLTKDESQVVQYQKQLKQMPIRILSEHHVIKREGDLISLNTGALTFEQKSHIKMLCETALREFKYENPHVRHPTGNRSEGDRDDTDVAGELTESVPGCIFCDNKIKDKIYAEYGSVVAMKDDFPVSEHHTLIIPKRHAADYFLLTEVEKRDADRLIEIIRKQITEQDPTVTGFNIGMNCGESAGQTIFHCHMHLIPRRDGDTPSPRGGVRGVIPEKMGY